MTVSMLSLITKLIICLMHGLSLLFRILHGLNHIQLPLFMLSKVNNARLRMFYAFIV